MGTVWLLFVTAALCLCVVHCKEKCCEEEIGCFTNDDPFDHLPLPDCFEDLQPSLQVYRLSDPDKGEVITQTTIPPNWSATQRTIFIIHGLLQTENAPWIKEMRPELLNREDCNVITVDWRYGSRTINYLQAASDIRTVGKVVANVANLLMESGGTTFDRLYCIGHSLGAHACGHAGKDAHIARITGLDPAGPLFETKNWTVGLNPSRADLVDVIHTHGEANVIVNLGTLKPMGHVDFYPNGGGQQPGCILDPMRRRRRRRGAEELKRRQKETIKAMSTQLKEREERQKPTRKSKQLNDVEDRPKETMMMSKQVDGIWVENGLPSLNGGADWMPVCSHLRANPLFSESVNTANRFIARHQCSDGFNIPDSCYSCGDECQAMGFDAEKYASRGIFYLETNSKTLYSMG